MHKTHTFEESYRDVMVDSLTPLFLKWLILEFELMTYRFWKKTLIITQMANLDGKGIESHLKLIYSLLKL